MNIDNHLLTKPLAECFNIGRKGDVIAIYEDGLAKHWGKALKRVAIWTRVLDEALLSQAWSWSPETQSRATREIKKTLTQNPVNLRLNGETGTLQVTVAKDLLVSKKGFLDEFQKAFLRQALKLAIYREWSPTDEEVKQAVTSLIKDSAGYQHLRETLTQTSIEKEYIPAANQVSEKLTQIGQQMNLSYSNWNMSAGTSYELSLIQKDPIPLSTLVRGSIPESVNSAYGYDPINHLPTADIKFKIQYYSEIIRALTSALEITKEASDCITLQQSDINIESNVSWADLHQICAEQSKTQKKDAHKELTIPVDFAEEIINTYKPLVKNLMQSITDRGKTTESTSTSVTRSLASQKASDIEIEIERKKVTEPSTDNPESDVKNSEAKSQDKQGQSRQ